MELNEKSLSKSQQRLMGMAYAVRNGKLDRSKVSDEVLKLADGKISDKDLKDFAKTKHDDLPNNKTNENYTMKHLKLFESYTNESKNEFDYFNTLDASYEFKSDKEAKAFLDYFQNEYSKSNFISSKSKNWKPMAMSQPHIFDLKNKAEIFLGIFMWQRPYEDIKKVHGISHKKYLQYRKKYGLD